MTRECGLWDSSVIGTRGDISPTIRVLCTDGREVRARQKCSILTRHRSWACANYERAEGCLMSCTVCTSINEAEFTAEMMIHFSGRRDIDNPGLLTFPKVSVCLDCGCSRFTTPEADLRILKNGRAASEAA